MNMGMATIEKPETKNPTCNGTVVCWKCDAEFSKDMQWARGYDKNCMTTSPAKFIQTSIVPFGCCPMCLSRIFNKQ